VKKPVLEPSSEAPSQESQTMRFSDELSAAEVVRLMGQVRRVPAVVSGYGGVHGNESGVNKEWLR